MAVLKGVISLYRAGEEKPIERYKARIGHFRIALCLLPALKKNLIDFLGLNDQAKKSGLGSFDLKLYPCTKSLVKPGFYPGPSLVKKPGYPGS